MRNPVRKSYYVSIGFALGGVAWLIYAVIANTDWVIFADGVFWLWLAGGWLLLARQLGHREQLHQAVPGAGQDVLTLVRQGWKIEAIKRYRALNPGIGLREAKKFIDEL